MRWILVGLDGGGEVELDWGTIVVGEEVSGWGGEGAGIGKWLRWVGRDGRYQD